MTRDVYLLGWKEATASQHSWVRAHWGIEAQRAYRAGYEAGQRAVEKAREDAEQLYGGA